MYFITQETNKDLQLCETTNILHDSKHDAVNYIIDIFDTITGYENIDITDVCEETEFPTNASFDGDYCELSTSKNFDVIRLIPVKSIDDLVEYDLLSDASEELLESLLYDDIYEYVHDNLPCDVFMNDDFYVEVDGMRIMATYIGLVHMPLKIGAKTVEIYECALTVYFNLELDDSTDIGDSSLHAMIFSDELFKDCEALQCFHENGFWSEWELDSY